MKKSFIIGLMMTLGGLTSVASYAEDGAEKPAVEEPEELAKYERTGKVRHCVGISFIDHTQVLDDQHILFHMKGKKVFLNKLPRRCPRLGFEKSFAYKVSINQLCNVDIITVFDNSGIPGPSCGLGDFEEVKKIEKETDDGEKGQE